MHITLLTLKSLKPIINCSLWSKTSVVVKTNLNSDLVAPPANNKQLEYIEAKKEKAIHGFGDVYCESL